MVEIVGKGGDAGVGGGDTVGAKRIGVRRRLAALFVQKSKDVPHSFELSLIFQLVEPQLCENRVQWKGEKGKKQRAERERERNEWGPMDLAFGTTVILEGNFTVFLFLNSLGRKLRRAGTNQDAECHVADDDWLSGNHYCCSFC